MIYLVLDTLQVLLQKVDSVELNMRKLMTCVMRIQRSNGEDADLDLQAAKSLQELEELEERLKDVQFRRKVVCVVFFFFTLDALHFKVQFIDDLLSAWFSHRTKLHKTEFNNPSNYCDMW